jgi:GT2 family glycosyltransferase
LRDVEEVVVVDNASQDATCYYARSFQSVRVIENRTNRGFAAGVNQGVAATTSRNVLILNPDAVPLDSLTPVIEAAEKWGAAAGRLVGSDGRTQSGFTIRRFPTPLALAFEALGVNAAWPGNRVNRRYRYLDRDLLADGPVEQPAGAFLVVRRNAFEKLRGFDERYFPVWFEDVDFCRRLALAGYTIWYESGVRARHTGAHSVSSLEVGIRELYWYRSLLRYAGKYFTRPQFRAVGLAVAAGAVLRMTVSCVFKRGGWPTAGAYRKVLRLALSSLLWSKAGLESTSWQAADDMGGTQPVLPGTLRN